MKHKAIAAAGLLIILLGVLIYMGNQNVGVTEYEVKVAGLPDAFDGMRVVQLSDLHNVKFRDGNKKLLELTADAEPDVIFITGDMLDSRRTDAKVALELAEALTELAPVYYVTGNHEARIGEYADFEQAMEQLGITLLRNRTVTLERNGELLNIAGVDDPAFGAGYAGWQAAGDGCTLLLAHRPELFKEYAEGGADLVFSGHVHGGQIRLPVLGGVYGPGQGFFPEYDSGVYSTMGSTMIVSRGIGNSIFPFRVNNAPEIVLAVLRQG